VAAAHFTEPALHGGPAGGLDVHGPSLGVERTTLYRLMKTFGIAGDGE
jgi:hypothetical protein